MTPHKRARLSAPSAGDPLYQSKDSSPPASLSHSSSYSSVSQSSTSASSFRNVSACNRCRVRKNRCDQNLPACTPCEKVGVKCTGFDPITKREIPRTYVYYLESRIDYLESILTNHGIPFGPPQEFDLGAKPVADQSTDQSPNGPGQRGGHISHAHILPTVRSAREQKQDEADKLERLVSNIGMVSVQGTSDPRFLGSTSGISFARVVFAAVRSSVPSTSSDKKNLGKSKAGGRAAAANGPSMRDSFFGLQSKPTITPAPFPEEGIGRRLLDLYFQHANPQIPVLHRGDFLALFERAYASENKSPRELYMLNIVFAIGAGIILEDSRAGRADSTGSPVQKPDVPTQQKQPEEYHSAAMQHLESFLGSMSEPDHAGFGGGLEELQAVLLLAGFALLRPVAPGLWYITGVAVRLAVDLGLHYEDGLSVDEMDQQQLNSANKTTPAGNLGQREWMRDLRRRLWWCVYSFDRLVSTCVGRPFGITDQVITTEFPSVLDDVFITKSGFSVPPDHFMGPSYKRVSHHYFRLRLLQSEILQVLQYRQAQRMHESKKHKPNEYMHTKLSSSFLQNFVSFHAWRKDIDRRLWEWKESAPLQGDTTVQFSVQFLELNYWQAVIMLYRHSLSVPPTLAGEVSPSDDVASPMSVGTDDFEDEDDIYLKVAEAGQRVLKLYRQLHRKHLVNYTYLATVHLFMAGIAFLYAIWHSPTVRSRLTLDDVEYTVRAATSVLADLVTKCPPAEACREAFDRMSKATIKMSVTTTGFKPPLDDDNSAPKQQDYKSTGSPQSIKSERSQRASARPTRPPPQFDMNLRDLFPELQEGASLEAPFRQWQPGMFSTRSQPHTLQPQNFPPVQPQYGTNLQTPIPLTTINNADDPYALPNELDFLLNSEDMMMYDGNPGIDLGFDGGEHKWADGPQVDLFDGFFFGGMNASV